MSKQILINSSSYEIRVASIENSEIRSLHIEREEDRNVVGNIYKGVVKRVLPGMQAAFLELGLERTAFLYVDDIIDEPFGMDVEVVDDEDLDGENAGDSETKWSDKDDESIEEDSYDESNQDKKESEFADSESSTQKSDKPKMRASFKKKGSRFSQKKFRKKVNIRDLLTEGQEILVQVAKAPIGTKGARLTTHISLPGRNVVLMPTVKHLGISRKIENDKERRRLRDIFLRKIDVGDVGFIVRTVAENKAFKDLKADVDYLAQLWDSIQKDSQKKRAPALIHEDLSLSMRAVRDFFTDDVDSLIVDNSKDYNEVMQFIDQFTPHLKTRVKLFKGKVPLFEHYGIEAEISRALSKKVWLKSGGYLLIDQSEALTAVDVNTGRYVGSKSLEETILKTNLEAVKEIAYQLRIRNVGGIIIIDLIDMESHENKEKVYQALQDALGEDKSKTNILKISDLGLVEMTRKRTHEDLVRYLTESCHYCEGRGYYKSQKTVSFEVFREIEKEALEDNETIVVFASNLVVNHLKKQEKDHIKRLEQKIGKSILIKSDPDLHVEQFEVFGR